MARKTETQTGTFDPSTMKAPEDFKKLSGGPRVIGWFAIQAGNAIQGILHGSFEVPSRFKRDDGKKTKTVFRIEVTSANPAGQGATLFRETDADPDDTELTQAKVGDLIGIDEKGFLQCLNRIEDGGAVWVACMGKQAPSEQYPQGAWQFDVRVDPSAKLKDSDGVPF